ncbi:hypothetical protein [uncultured Brachyspira sp.]|uniref:hypothetical protein n=1 Tax=uncultured Brachyspira sp. TaxID=221953 RepID=UPI0026293C9D|nr:hypothetical protein [uncultured Brachyspira sp.]
MNKKLLTIFLSLFLVGILSVSCSNKDKTGSSGIEQFNGNSYVSASTINGSQVYLWVSIKDGTVGIYGYNSNTSEPSYPGYMNVTGSGTDYNFYSGIGDAAGTLKFASDGSSVTVRFTKNTQANDIVGQNIVCNKK